MLQGVCANQNQKNSNMNYTSVQHSFGLPQLEAIMHAPQFFSPIFFLKKNQLPS